MIPFLSTGRKGIAFLFLAIASAFGAKNWTYPAYTSPKDLPYVPDSQLFVYAKGRTSAGDIDLLMDGYFPKGLESARKAAVIFIHPGSFLNGDRSRMAPHCLNLAKKGVVGFSIEYRKQNDTPSVELPRNWVQVDPSDLPKGPLSPNFKRSVNAAIIDAKAAIRYVHARSDELGIDPANIFVAGGSAGAITALTAGVTPDDLYVSDSLGKPIRPENHPGASMSVRGIVDWSGGLFLDLEQLDAQDPPIMIYHGDKDNLVPYAHAELIKSRCDSLGLECELHTVPDGDHLPTEGAPAGTFEEVTTSFVMRHLSGGTRIVREGTLAAGGPVGRWRILSGRVQGTDLPPDVVRIDLAGPDGSLLHSSAPSTGHRWSAPAGRGVRIVVLHRRSGAPAPCACWRWIDLRGGSGLDRACP